MEQAAATRRKILQAARELFSLNGYEATRVIEVARLAGVSVDTVYASVGRKPDLVRAVIDTVLGGADDPAPPMERDYVREVRAAGGAAGKLRVYSAALGRVMPTAAPLMEALQRAGDRDAQSHRAWVALAGRRAENMLVLAAELRATGQLRPDLSDQWVADVLWSTNSPQYYLLLASRGWDPTTYSAWLADLWQRTLLDGDADRDAASSPRRPIQLT